MVQKQTNKQQKKTLYLQLVPKSGRNIHNFLNLYPCFSCVSFVYVCSVSILFVFGNLFFSVRVDVWG